MMAWHWVMKSDTGPVLRDGRPVVVGEWVEHDGKLELCISGLHASEDILDALRYAPGAVVCRVECDGEIVRDTDKLACTRRRVEWMIDAESVLRLFACDCAERALTREREAGREPDARSWRAIEVARGFAVGSATRDDLIAASAAAWAAYDAANAAHAAAWAAYDAAAWAASAAANAAHAAAWAAYDAANAASAAAWAAYDAANAAAWAAHAAAWDAERTWQRDALIARLDSARGEK